jgi:hypothetical protein
MLMPMPKRSKPVDFEKLEVTRNWCLTILEFGRSDFPEEIYAMTLEIFTKVFDGGKPSEIRDIIVAAKELGGALDPPRQQQLNELLQSRFGWDLRDESGKDLRILRKLLRRGKLKTDDEARFVQDHLDDQEKAERLTATEVTKIKELLIAYATR